jgi:hypothetical protein
MICTPDQIRTQLPINSYRRLQWGHVNAAKWNAWDIEHHNCGKRLKASSLSRHLEAMHNVYKQTMVAKELLELRPARTYKVTNWSLAGLACLFLATSLKKWE